MLFFVSFQLFTDGTTNKLVGCYIEDDPEDMVLVRVYGNKTELIVDRDNELKSFQVVKCQRMYENIRCLLIRTKDAPVLTLTNQMLTYCLHVSFRCFMLTGVHLASIAHSRTESAMNSCKETLSGHRMSGILLYEGSVRSLSVCTYVRMNVGTYLPTNLPASLFCYSPV